MLEETFYICARAYYPGIKFRDCIFAGSAGKSIVLIRRNRSEQDKFDLKRLIWLDDITPVMSADTPRNYNTDSQLLKELRRLSAEGWHRL